jgi:hypothetical protein
VVSSCFDELGHADRAVVQIDVFVDDPVGALEPLALDRPQPSAAVAANNERVALIQALTRTRLTACSGWEPGGNEMRPRMSARGPLCPSSKYAVCR